MPVRIQKDPGGGIVPGSRNRQSAWGDQTALITTTANLDRWFQTLFVEGSTTASHFDPVGDALHYRCLDPEIAVRRHPLAGVGASGDLAAGHHYQLRAR
jgi:hypothetical protein